MTEDSLPLIAMLEKTRREELRIHNLNFYMSEICKQLETMVNICLSLSGVVFLWRSNYY